MYTFVRHSIKSHSNSSDLGKRLDADITLEGVSLVRNKASRLLNKGFERIVTSPYLRTRSTALVMADILGIEEIIVDPLLSECLHFQKSISEDDFYPETLDYGAVGIETVEEFTRRMLQFIDAAKVSYGSKTLFVTHGYNIAIIADLTYNKMKEGHPRMGWYYTLKL